jgi:hypothetical protein
LQLAPILQIAGPPSRADSHDAGSAACLREYSSSVPKQGLGRIAGVLIGGAAFGVGISLIKGSGGGVRDVIGNASAPWLLLPFIAGAVAGDHRVARAALIGLVVSLVAVVGFYTVYVLVVLGIRPRSVSEFVHLALVSGARWLVLGAISGPVFGALGGWWQLRRSLVAGLLAASLLLFEPPAWLVWTPDSVHYPVVWGVEIALGVLAAAIVCSAARTRDHASQTPY